MSTRNELKAKWLRLKEQGQTTIQVTISTNNKATVEKVKNHIADAMLNKFDLALTWDIEEVKD